jgi:hypothetical protein
VDLYVFYDLCLTGDNFDLFTCFWNIDNGQELNSYVGTGNRI